MRKLGKILLFCLAGIVILALLSTLALKLALDRAPEYQSQIKAWVYAQIGYHVAFDGIAPSLRWYGPELHFVNIELRSEDNQRVLARAAGARVAADIWQLILSGRLLAGRIEIDSPTLTVARIGAARFALGSEINLSADDSPDGNFRVETLPAGKLAIRHAHVTMQNWNAALPQLVLNDVNVDLRRDGAGIGFALNAHLPPTLGGELIASGKTRGGGELQALNWTVLLSARDVSFPGWRLLLPDFLSGLNAGTGAFELAASGQGGSLARADLDFNAAAVVTQLADGPALKFEQIGGVLHLLHANGQWSLVGKKVRALRLGRRDPDSQFEITWRTGPEGLLNLRARASYLRADTLLPLSGLLPQKEVRERLRDLAPTGEWIDTSLVFARDAVQAPARLEVQAKFRDVGFAPFGRAPGLRGLSGVISGNERAGNIVIDTKTAVFAWPLQLAQPIDLDTLKATLYWKRTADELLIATSNWEMRNKDAAVQGKVAWRKPADGTSPLLTLASVVTDGNAANTRKYLLREPISPRALAWLNRAFIGGRLSRADVVIQGPIRHFPFRDGSGLFLARCALQGMTLDYGEGWPRIEDLSAQAEFRNEGMVAHLQSGRIGSVAIEAAEARFADFKTGELEVHLAARGDSADALKFLRATPLDAIADHAFSAVDAAGPLRTKVDLFLPFKDFAHRRLLVHGVLDGAALNRPGSALRATDLRGEFDVDGAQLARADIRGRVLGGPFQMQAHAPHDRAVTRTDLEFRGTLTAEALRAALPLPAGARVAGQTEWRALLKMAPDPKRERTLRVSSTLGGLQLELPAPLDKAADASLPSWFEVQWPSGESPQGRFALDSILSGSYAMQSDANGMRLAHAAITFGTGESIVANSQMINVGGRVARLDLGGWLKLGGPDKSARPLTDYLNTARLQVGELDYLGLVFRDVSLNLAAAKSGTRLAVGGPNVAGTISWPNGSDEPLNLQFERLHFDVAPGAPDSPGSQQDASAAGQAPNEPQSSGDPRSIPAINFRASDVKWGARRFGNVQAALVKLDDGIRLKQLNATNAGFDVNATGEWRGKGAGAGRVEGTLTSTDVQETLKQLGYGELIEAKSGHVDFDLTWLGAPSGDPLAQAAGRVQLTLAKGQILGLKPGVGRVLGLASVAEIGRRLSLDFSDLTDTGLAFDTVEGDFDLRGGSAYTDNLLLKGPAAEIGLIGRVGLKNKDYDQTAVVTGSLGNSLPLAALAGGPVVGAAVLLFTQVFKQPLKGLARGYYRITGSWEHPTVERITSAVAAAATAEAPK